MAEAPNEPAYARLVQEPVMPPLTACVRDDDDPCDDRNDEARRVMASEGTTRVLVVTDRVAATPRRPFSTSRSTRSSCPPRRTGSSGGCTSTSLTGSRTWAFR